MLFSRRCALSIVRERHGSDLPSGFLTRNVSNIPTQDTLFIYLRSWNVVADFPSIKPLMVDQGRALQRYGVVSDCPDCVVDTKVLSKLDQA